MENAYVGLENDLQRQIDNIPSTYPGYDEYRYDLDEIMHNPHELASFLTSILPRYTLAEVQAELQRVFSKQYTLTTTTTVEVRYRRETRTDSEGNSYTVQVPYNYYILNVKLTARSIASIAPELLTPEQLEMFNIYLQTSGNNPLVFGGGSPDISASEDISGVHFVNGTRPGNTAVVDIAKSQVGNVNGQPYWSWYGFDSRVEWCACVYYKADRRRTVGRMTAALPDMDGDMQALARQTIRKLEAMTDADFEDMRFLFTDD